MSKEDMLTIESLIIGGVIVALLATLITDNKTDVVLSALAGAAATIQANKNALKTNLPFVREENGKFYKIMPVGKKELIRVLVKPAKTTPQKFILS